MEYAEGETLEQKMQLNLSYDPNTWRDIIVQIIKAVMVIDEAGLCHGDIKAENVVVTPKNQVKLVDFGRTRRVEVSDDSLCLAALIFQLLDKNRRNLRVNQYIEKIVLESEYRRGHQKYFKKAY